MSLTALDRFIGGLASISAPAHAFNPWRDGCHVLDVDPVMAAAARRARLRAFLTVEPLLILAGEAPGHLGCRYAGIAFTSEVLLATGQIPRVKPTGRFTNRSKPLAEPTATMVWETLASLGIADRVVTWNAFAFHPHIAGRPHSNRKPTAADLELTRELLTEFLGLYPGVPLVAVGNTAADTIAKLGASATPVRHPSYGGKNDFVRELRAIAVSLGIAREQASLLQDRSSSG